MIWWSGGSDIEFRNSVTKVKFVKAEFSQDGFFLFKQLDDVFLPHLLYALVLMLKDLFLKNARLNASNFRCVHMLNQKSMLRSPLRRNNYLIIENAAAQKL